MRPQRQLLALFAVRLSCPLPQLRQVRTPDDESNDDQNDGHEQIGELRRLRIRHAFGQSKLRPLQRGAPDCPAQDEIAAEIGCEERTHRVESLNERQPRFRTLGRTYDRNVGIGRHLKQGDATRYHKEREKSHPIGDDLCRTDHPERTDGHDCETEDEGVLVTNPLDQERRRHTHDAIGDEPDRLDDRRLEIIELEYTTQMRQERVVDYGYKAPHEE